MKTSARQTVATAAVVSAGIIVLAELDRSGDLPPANQLIAYAVVFTFLSVLADFGLEFAGGLSLIAMAAILFGPQLGSKGDDIAPIEHALRFLGSRGGFSK
jgi:hypothetical protein